MSAGYHSMVFSSPERYAETIEAVLRTARRAKRQTKFKNLAFIGVSGSSLGYPLAWRMNIAPVHVRKTGDDSHSWANVEGPQGYKDEPYAFVDDFISSGKTYKRVVEMMGHPPVAIITRNSAMGSKVGLEEYEGVPIFNADVKYA